MDTIPRDDMGLPLSPDAGINSSAAWTEHFDTVPLTLSSRSSMLGGIRFDGRADSDGNESMESEEVDEGSTEGEGLEASGWRPSDGIPARALKTFQGDEGASEL